MKNLTKLYILLLFPFLGLGQTTPALSVKVDVVKNRSVTETIRDQYVVPVGEFWEIYNVTASRKEIWNGSAWVALGGGDNLGDHTATTTLDLANNGIQNVGGVSLSGGTGVISGVSVLGATGSGASVGSVSTPFDYGYFDRVAHKAIDGEWWTWDTTTASYLGLGKIANPTGAFGSLYTFNHNGPTSAKDVTTVEWIAAQNFGLGNGDFLADGSVPMADDLELGGNDINDVQSIQIIDSSFETNINPGFVSVKDLATPNEYSSLASSGLSFNKDADDGTTLMTRSYFDIMTRQTTLSSSSDKLRIFGGDNIADPDLLVAEFFGRVKAKDPQLSTDLVTKGYADSNYSGGSTESTYLEPTGTTDITLANTNFVNGGEKVINLYTTSRDIIFPAAVTDNTIGFFKASAAGITVNLKPDTGQVFEGTALDDLGNKVFVSSGEYIELEPHESANVGRKESGVFFIETDGEAKSLFDADTQAFIDAHGGLSSVEQSALDVAVRKMKADGTWDQYDVLYPILGDSAAEHAINLKNPGGANDLTFAGTPTHGTNSITGNGTDAIADTNYVFADSRTEGNATFMFWTNTDNGGNHQDMGTKSASRRAFFETWSGNINWDLYSTGDNRLTATSPANEIGMWTGTQRTTTDKELYYNGSSVGIETASTLSDGNSVLTGSVGLMGVFDTSGVASGFSSKQYYIFGIGEGMSDTDVSNDFSTWSTFNTAIGR